MTTNSLDLAKNIIKILDSKKGQNLKLIEVKELTTIADYFVLANGNSTTQVKSLANEVEFQLKQQGVEIHHTEGFNSASWILLDYTTVIVNIFLPDSRDFYKLEKMWADGIPIDISDITKE